MLAPHRPRSTILRILGGTALCALALGARQSPAQDASTYYTVQHPKEFKIDWAGFYRKGEELTAATRKALPNHLNIPYGADPKQRLDVYLPVKKPVNAPVLIFIHGGGFREGDRAQYGFIAKPYADRGVITVVASYRLTGDGFKYPDQPHDIRAVVKWVYQHIAADGGDPQRIYLSGHSAGAILSADLGADVSWMKEAGIPTKALRGIVPVSGTYDMDIEESPGEVNVYAPTKELAAKASPIEHIKAPVPVAIVAVGAAENAREFVDSSRAFADKLAAAGVQTKFLNLPGEDHRATVESLANPDSELFKSVMDMISGRKVAAAH
jgi:acetyl esterase/lipase